MAGGRKKGNGSCFEGGKRMVRHCCIGSLVPSPCAPPGEKQSGEQSRLKIGDDQRDCEIGNYYIAPPLQQ